MPSTYSNLKVQLMATGENTGTWGNVTNDNLGVALEQAIVETATVTFASANVTLTLTDTNARQDARALRLNLAGTTGGARDLIVPAIQKPYLVNNGTADTITVKVSGQTGVAVPASTSMLLYNNGTDVVVAFNRVVGNVVGNVTGNVSGLAGSAATLQTARNIGISGGATAANVSFDGSAAVNLNVTGLNVSTADAGTLSVGRGGTGATTLNSEAVVIGNSTGAVKFVAPGTSGNVLTSNGTAWASQAIAAGGNYVMQVYNSPATWTKPANVKAVRVSVVGGGGGGGNSQFPTNARNYTGGGGGGGVAYGYVTAPSLPGPQPVSVGSGGAGGSSGGTSSFGTFLSATGGANGANGGPGGPSSNAGGAGGSGSGPAALVTISGGSGSAALNVEYIGSGGAAGGGEGVTAFVTGDGVTYSGGGKGGSGGWGRGGNGGTGPAPQNATQSVGNAGSGYGSGGGGAVRYGPSPVGTTPGASGSAGVVIVEEFY